MARRRDPVEEAAEEGRDLYDVATWERRTVLDSFATVVHRLLLLAGRVAVILAALAILVVQFALGGMSAAQTDPVVVALVVLSVVPALLLAAYVWRSGVTERQPVRHLVASFLLGVLFAMFAAVVNSLGQGAFAPLLDSGGVLAGLGTVLFFYVVVAPVEETVKLLAVRLHAFRRFTSVVDGAVYGAAAGLGFATIENYIYITRSVAPNDGGLALVGAAGGIAAVRALAGPGHVIYSSLAGYYLGLARFNREHAGPLVVKGLLIAAFVHGTYNVLVGPVSTLLSATMAWADGPLVGYVGFVVAYDGLFGLLLYRKLRKYGRAHREVNAASADAEERPGEEPLPGEDSTRTRLDPGDLDP